MRKTFNKDGDNMMKILFDNKVFLLVSVLVSLPVSGATIYTTGFDPTKGASSSNADADSFIRQQVADDFVLNNSTSISEIGWFGSFTNVGIQDSYTNGFNIRIYNDNSGLPDSTPLYDFEKLGLVGAGVGYPNVNFHERFAYSTLLDNPILLDSGTYWISIISNTNLTFGWSYGFQDTPEYRVARSSFDDGAWRAITNVSKEDFAFAIGAPLSTGWDNINSPPPPPEVPTPSAVWLFGSGLLGLIGLARRKRN